MENPKNTTKGNSGSKGETALQRWMKELWSFFEKNQIARWLMYGVTSFASLFALKHFIYDRFLPLN